MGLAKQWRNKISFAKPPVCKPPPPPWPQDLCPQTQSYINSFLCTSQIQVFDTTSLHNIFAETWMHATSPFHWDGQGPAFYKIDPPPPITWDLSIHLFYGFVPCYNNWTFVLTPSGGLGISAGNWDVHQNLPSLTPVHFVGEGFSVGNAGTVDAQC
jgi:hypothetical protein